MLTGLKRRVPVSARRRVKIARAKAAEALGSDRYAWPALNQLDRKVIPYLPERGTFLEIGANDGYSQSNTYQLAKRGWTGILIEPLPQLYEACLRIRPESQVFRYACAAPGAPAVIELANEDLEASVVSTGRFPGSATVTARVHTLSEVIDEAQVAEIDFMSVDVEGFELDVLAGLDLTRHTPGYLLIETSRPDDVDSLLSDSMKRVGKLSFHDYLYERQLSTERRQHC